MSDIQYQVYDFASSARVERPLWLPFHHWMQKFAELFVEHWTNYSLTTVEASSTQIDASPFEDLQQTWEKPAYGVELSFKNDAVWGMLVIDRVELLALLMDILGDSGADEIKDRELTTVETSLCQLVFEQAASTIGEAWVEQETLDFNLEEVTDQPNRSRLFPPTKEVLTSGLKIQLPNSQVNLKLLLGKQETSDLLAVEQREPVQVVAGSQLSSEKIAEISVQLSAGLGKAELAMTDLVTIAPGDVIMLDQSIEEPVTLFANEEPVFHAWPGRLANQQVLKIVSAFENHTPEK